MQRAEPGQQQGRIPDDAARSLVAELDRGGGGEDARDHEPERGRELEAGIRAEQHRGCREGVQAEEAGARDEGERDEEESSVASSARGRADRPAERRGHRGCSEHEPEVRLLVLPADIDRRACEQDREQNERSGDDGEPVSGVHSAGVRLQPDLVLGLETSNRGQAKA